MHRAEIASVGQWQAFHSQEKMTANCTPHFMFQPIAQTGCSRLLDLLQGFCFLFVLVGMSTSVTDLERDIELLRRIGTGDRSAFGSFYDHHSGLLFSIAVKILNDAGEAEDVLQEVFMQIWDKADTYNPLLGKPTSWAVTLTRNKAIDRIRSSHRRSKLLEQATAEASVLLPDDSPSANETMLGKETAEMIRTVVVALPSDQRRAIELAFFNGLTQDEIARTLQEPLGTIKARIRRGMLKLREQLEAFI